MAYKFSFADNVVYGAEDINAIVNRLVTGGVAEVCYDGESYNTSDLNAITAYIATYGARDVSSTTLQVVKTGEGSIKVLSGCAFMNDGASVEVDSEGVDLTYTEGQTNYVYIKNNLDATNSIDFVCSLSEGTGDIVPLATISADGTITDTRVYCRGKLAGYQSTAGLPKEIEVAYSISANIYGSKQTVTVDMGGLSYGKIFNLTARESDSTPAQPIGFYDISTDTYVSSREADDGENHYIERECMPIYVNVTSNSTDIVSVKFTVNGSELVCEFTAVYGSGSDETKYKTFEGTAYLFLA